MVQPPRVLVNRKISSDDGTGGARRRQHSRSPGRPGEHSRSPGTPRRVYLTVNDDFSVAVELSPA
jgi:hypothetical protein